MPSRDIVCDACKATFPLMPQAETTEQGEIQFFVCPACGARYTYAHVSPAGLRMRADMNTLEHALKKSTDPKLRSRYEQLQAAYRNEVRPGQRAVS